MQSFIVSTKMKLAVVLLCLSVAVMVGMVFQSVRQELHLRHLKTRMVLDSVDVKRKEEAIVDAKNKIQGLKTTLDSVNSEMDQLKKKKVDAEKSTQEHDKTLQACNSEKEEVEKKNASVTEDLTKLKADHEAAKKKAEEEIQSLKQEILDRDKAICAFVDTTKEEARKLCGITVAKK